MPSRNKLIMKAVNLSVCGSKVQELVWGRRGLGRVKGDRWRGKSEAVLEGGGSFLTSVFIVGKHRVYC